MNESWRTIPLDPVSIVLAGISGWVVGDAGMQMSAYIVVIASTLVGTLFALKRRPESSTTPWPLLAAMLIGAVSLSGVGITMMIERATSLPFLWLLSPVCIFLAAIGEDWPKVGAAILDRGGAFIDTVLRKKDGGGT